MFLVIVIYKTPGPWSHAYCCHSLLLSNHCFKHSLPGVMLPLSQVSNLFPIFICMSLVSKIHALAQLWVFHWMHSIGLHHPLIVCFDCLSLWSHTMLWFPAHIQIKHLLIIVSMLSSLCNCIIWVEDFCFAFWQVMQLFKWAVKRLKIQDLFHASWRVMQLWGFDCILHFVTLVLSQGCP